VTERLLPAPAGPGTRSPNAPAALRMPPAPRTWLSAAATDQIQTALVVIRVRLAETENSVCSRLGLCPVFGRSTAMPLAVGWMPRVSARRKKGVAGSLVVASVVRAKVGRRRRRRRRSSSTRQRELYACAWEAGEVSAAAVACARAPAPPHAASKRRHAQRHHATGEHAGHGAAHAGRWEWHRPT
jgi:hypothetical protein